MIDSDQSFEIVAESSTTGDDRALVLASGDTFAIFDRHGEIHAGPAARHGLYCGGTRFLSGLWLLVADHRPLLLSSGIRSEQRGLFVHEANPDVRDHRALRIERDQIHIVRHVRLEDGLCEIEFSLRSYAAERVALPVRIGFAADYLDVFEVRGAQRPRRGIALAPDISKDGIELGYTGLDGATRTTRLAFDPPPVRTSASSVQLLPELEPGGQSGVDIQIRCELRERGVRGRPGRFAVPARAAPTRDLAAAIVTSSAPTNWWIRRSSADLAMLTAPTRQGPLPYAGIPWFSTPFGRDALVTAYETLWIEPSLARGVLRFLAAHQADFDDPERDAEPGKIIHEMRSGEMATLGEVPFAQYYGTVDATPLFVMVAAAYFERTGDLGVVQELWPNLERAMAWIDGPGDPDGDGFVEYQRRSSNGLVNQGWKDSRDSVMHADGSLARGPIALCEVQSYVYGAKLGLARIARRLGHAERAAALEVEAERLRDAFAASFWCEDLGTYALALDGDKKPCRVRTSNAGHVLLTGLAPPEHAEVVARTLLSADHYSGWGIRTLAASAPRYNPMSYHDGSVWPHDNALIAAGLARCGDTRAAAAIGSGLFDACRALEDARLPELFCGFDRRPGEPPTLYPVACSPQAWAAGAVFLLLQASLGLAIDAEAGAITFARPVLPAGVDQISLHGLEVGSGSVDLLLERSGDAAEMRVLRACEGIDVTVRP